MLTIHKFEIPSTGSNVGVRLPIGATVQSVGLDPAGKLCLWAIVDYNETVFNYYRLAVIGTGWDITHFDLNGAKFLGTVVQTIFVWHIYDLGWEK